MISIGTEGYDDYVRATQQPVQQPVRRQANGKRFRLYCRCSSEQGWISAAKNGVLITKFSCSSCKHFMWTFTKLTKNERGF